MAFRSLRDCSETLCCCPLLPLSCAAGERQGPSRTRGGDHPRSSLRRTRSFFGRLAVQSQTARETIERCRRRVPVQSDASNETNIFSPLPPAVGGHRRVEVELSSPLYLDFSPRLSPVPCSASPSLPRRAMPSLSIATLLVSLLATAPLAAAYVNAYTVCPNAFFNGTVLPNGVAGPLKLGDVLTKDEKESLFRYSVAKCDGLGAGCVGADALVARNPTFGGVFAEENYGNVSALGVGLFTRDSPESANSTIDFLRLALRRSVLRWLLSGSK